MKKIIILLVMVLTFGFIGCDGGGGGDDDPYVPPVSRIVNVEIKNVYDNSYDMSGDDSGIYYTTEPTIKVYKNWNINGGLNFPAPDPIITKILSIGESLIKTGINYTGEEWGIYGNPIYISVDPGNGNGVAGWFNCVVGNNYFEIDYDGDFGWFITPSLN